MRHVKKAVRSLLKQGDTVICSLHAKLKETRPSVEKPTVVRTAVAQDAVEGETVMGHLFLSPEWIDEAEQIYERHRHHGTGAGLPSLVVNLVVDGAPFDGGEVLAHSDTSSGDLVIRRGHAESCDLTVRLDYETAKSLMVDQDPQLAIEALIFGRVRIEGDLTALSNKTDLDLTQLPALLQSLNLGGLASLADVDPVAGQIADELRAITA